MCQMLQTIIQIIITILKSVDFWKIFIPAISAITAWFLNERSKRLSEEFIRKEERYKKLLESIEGFTPDNKNKPELRKHFLKELQLSWLYCPDEVIIAVNNFIDEMQKEDSNMKLAIQNIIFSIRKDLLSRKVVRKTELKPENYKHIKFTDEKTNP